MRLAQITPGRRYFLRRTGEFVKVIEVVPPDPYPHHHYGPDDHRTQRANRSLRLEDGRRVTSRQLEPLP